MIDLQALAKAELHREPFQFMAVRKVIDDEDLSDIRHDFPKIEQPGLFPLTALTYGPAFRTLIEEINSRELAEVVGDKFGLDLTSLPLMITVRGHAQAKDGRIHTDTEDKIVTCLLYLNNDEWDQDGGRLRLLRSGDSLDDVVTEIAPNGGSFAAFRVAKNSFHGHKPFVGPRRYVMFNWLRSDAALSRQLGRHKFSAKLKGFVASITGH